ncbi:hypothetical protein NUW58_g3074 [Xylaria curta]|uniref:Uncharacterized protein n=1 Tax=Xylaria curta TaxID=42375 RepID=A0ACC1PCL4_9PEZI|nr:hypothetical protein NUW58_g3074 [Xylaria curta]
MESGCVACKRLWRFLVDTESSGSIRLEDFSHGMFCSYHTSFTRQFLSKRGGSTSYISKDIYDDFVRLIDTPYRPWRLQLANKASVSDHPGKGCILDPDWVDTDLLRKWKHICLGAHGERCDNSMKIWPTRPAWLIDVERKCLVSGQKCDDRFVALSYTYGTGSSSKIDNAATLSRLQVPDSLSVPEVSSSISPIIKHAMHLTAVLGERFLWADSLCIPHFDVATTTQQLNLMGAIYANAIITIIATSTDSDEGIPGLKGISDSRKLQQHVIPFGAEDIVARQSSTRYVFALERPYNYRGWTYQECMMSPRKLIFNREGLIWECLCSYKKEGMAADAEFPRNSLVPKMDTMLARFPDPQSMHQILKEFNDKELTYDADALPSITGLLSVFSRPFKGGFLYGLPEWLFDSALGWRVSIDFVGDDIEQWSPRRRKASSGPSGLGRVDLGPSKLPSWSWIGWRGPILTDHCDNACIYSLRKPVRETFPVTEWFTAKSPTAIASERRRILSTWSTDREVYKDSNTPLPPGWTRHEAFPYDEGFDVYKPTGVIYPGGCGSYVFQHEAMKKRSELFGNATHWWYYPVPVADITASTPPFTPEQTEYLFCTTYRACLWAAWNYNPVEESRVMDLFNAVPRKVGFLEPMSRLEDFPFIVKDGESDIKIPMGKQVELVAISRFKQYEKLKLANEGTFSDIVTEHIAVLWVEWVNGVAYRLGYGEVEKEEWGKLPLERIELVLG